MKAALPNITDEEWMAKECRNGDPFAQKQVYQLYADSMMLVCLRYIDNAEDAREVMLDAFYSFFKNIHSFTYLGAGSLQAWLKKITINQCLMYLRKSRSLIIASDKLGESSDVAIPENALDGMSVKEIMKLVHSLPDGYRTVFNLYVFEDKSHSEIAALLNISESTSKTQLYKARMTLQKNINKMKKI